MRANVSAGKRIKLNGGLGRRFALCGQSEVGRTVALDLLLESVFRPESGHSDVTNIMIANSQKR